MGLLPELRLSAELYRFRESLFLLPALVVVGGVVLAEVAAAVDERIGTETNIPATVDMSSNAATWLLSTVAGATITTAGVVFSLTVVSLQLASSQFSPRVMRSFIRDRLSQFVVGILVGTFVYSVLALRHIDAESSAPAPKIMVTVAVVLTVATVLLIIAHLNRLAHRLQVFRQLVDVGLRALSPAVNDPTTAVEASLRVGGLLRKVLVADLPPERVRGPEGRMLLRPYSLRHDEYVQHGFDQLRQASPTQPHVVATLLRVLRMLIQHVEDAGRPEHAPALRRQMRLLLDAVEDQPGVHAEDRTRLRAIASGSTDPADHENPVGRSGASD